MSQYKIAPLKTDNDYHQAVARVATLINSKPETPEGDELDILATLIDAYEARHFPMDASTPVAAIEFRLEQAGLCRNDLVPLIGSRARVSEVLAGKRTLTLPMIRRLRLGLGISADLLIPEELPTPVTGIPVAGIPAAGKPVARRRA